MLPVFVALLLASSAIAGPIAAQPDGFTCEFCEFAINELDKLLLDPTAIADFEKGLDWICVNLLTSEEQVCEAFVQKFGPQFVQFVVSELNATDICQFLDLCPAVPARSVLAPISKSLQAGSPADCKICTDFVGAFDTYLASPTTATDVEALLNPLCTKAGPFAQLCVDFIDQFTPPVLNYIATLVNATAFCDFIDVCPGQMRFPAREFAVNATSSLFAPISCAYGPDYYCSVPVAARACDTAHTCTPVQPAA
eukprot:m.222458 g.222458  ORF g.222458 m.222458 type:complete len:253 (-) comp10765_c0_seq1:47-805(-)